jgi:hypothetical protein
VLFPTNLLLLADKNVFNRGWGFSWRMVQPWFHPTLGVRRLSFTCGGKGQGRQCFSGRFDASAAEFQLLFEFATVEEANHSLVKLYVGSQREDGTRFLDAENIAYENRVLWSRVRSWFPSKTFSPLVFAVSTVDGGDVCETNPQSGGIESFINAHSISGNALAGL